MTGQFKEIKKTFIYNTIDELATLKKKLVMVKENAVADVDEQGLAEEVFFLMHGISGTAPMVGIENLASVSKKVEMVFDKIRNGERTFSEQINVQAIRGIDAILDELQAQSKKIAH